MSKNSIQIFGSWGNGVLQPHSLAVCTCVRTRAVISTELAALGGLGQGGVVVSSVPDLVRITSCASPYLDLREQREKP